MTFNPKNIVLCDFLAIFRCKRVNCDEMHGDRLRLPANRNCYRLSRVSWALAQISCCVQPVTIKPKRHLLRFFVRPLSVEPDEDKGQ